jgi:hypothetical protein
MAATLCSIRRLSVYLFPTFGTGPKISFRFLLAKEVVDEMPCPSLVATLLKSIRLQKARRRRTHSRRKFLKTTRLRSIPPEIKHPLNPFVALTPATHETGKSGSSIT